MKLAMVLSLAVLGGPPLSAIDVPAEWSFGSRSDDSLIEGTFPVRNTADAPITVTLLVSCDCLLAEPAVLTLNGGSSARIRVTFDPKGSSGPVRNAVLVRVRGGETADRVLTVRGTITPRVPASAGTSCAICASLEEQFRTAAAAPPAPLRLPMRYYYSVDCRSCTLFLQVEVPRLERMLGMEIVVELRDISQDANLREVMRALAGRGAPLTGFPVIAVNGVMLQGEAEIRERLAGVLLSTTSARRQ